MFEIICVDYFIGKSMYWCVSGVNKCKYGFTSGIFIILTLYENKLCCTVPEAAELLGFSRNFGYELAKTGQIPILRFGKRMVVPKAKFVKMLEKDD